MPLKLLERIFGHKCKWSMTHHNTYGIATREVCKCGMDRQKKCHKKCMCPWWRWEYADGTIGPWKYMFHRASKVEQIVTADDLLKAEDTDEFNR